MRFINLIVVHCSATRCDRCYTEHDLTTDHLRRGFSGAGYHVCPAWATTIGCKSRTSLDSGNR